MSHHITRRMSFLDRYLTVWIFLVMGKFYGGRVTDGVPEPITDGLGAACAETRTLVETVSVEPATANEDS